jgi:hypothetical protein
VSAPRFSVKRSFVQRLTDVPVNSGLPSVDELKDELLAYCDVLLGRTDPPVDHGVMTLMEVADAYFARASEIEMLIHEQERQGNVVRGSDHYKFRTGALRSFLDMSKKAAERGSRRLTHETLLAQMQRDAGA